MNKTIEVPTAMWRWCAGLLRSWDHVIESGFRGSDPSKERRSSKKELARLKAQWVQRSQEETLQSPLSEGVREVAQANVWR